MAVRTVACNIARLIIEEDKYHFMDLQFCVSSYSYSLIACNIARSIKQLLIFAKMSRI
jgi:hypothetical protein